MWVRVGERRGDSERERRDCGEGGEREGVERGGRRGERGRRSGEGAGDWERERDRFGEGYLRLNGRERGSDSDVGARETGSRRRGGRGRGRVSDSLTRTHPPPNSAVAILSLSSANDDFFR